MCSIPDGGNQRVTPHFIKNHINNMTTNMIKDKDTNQDKALSAEEMGGFEEIFARIDLNQDGQADKKELNVSNPLNNINRMTAHLIKNNDANDDHVLSTEELGIDEGKFAQIDQNGDGQADKKELTDFKFKILSEYMPPRAEESASEISVSA